MAVVHFGGPDLPRGALRDVLLRHVEAVPPGGTIDWATYYFRDIGLAEALVRARQRGVRVRVVIERRPRVKKANKPVASLLRAKSALGRDFQRFQRPKQLDEAEFKPHLHSKIYVFSHPKPHVLIGSFNPSGDGPDDDPEMIERIGDQDAGHNLLVELDDPVIVKWMRRRVRLLPWLGISEWVPYLPTTQRVARARERDAWFFPRRRRDVVEPLFAALKSGDRVRAALSHAKDADTVALFCDAAKRGVLVEVILNHTERRVPTETSEAFLAAGVEARRYERPDELPMHAKFMLVDRPGDERAPRFATYGSLNFNERSLRLNHEVFVRDRSREVFEQLDARWRSIAEECVAQAEATPRGPRD